MSSFSRVIGFKSDTLNPTATVSTDCYFVSTLYTILNCVICLIVLSSYITVTFFKYITIVYTFQYYRGAMAIS